VQQKRRLAAGDDPQHAQHGHRDAQRLPLRDASVDAVVSTEAFHWFPDKERALAEIFRVLVPGGRLLVAIVNTPNAAVRTIFQLASHAAGQPFDWPTRGEMRALCERGGFRVEAQRRVFRIPAGLSLPPVLTIHGDKDPTVPYEHGAKITKALRDAGNDAEMITVPEGKHGFPPEKLAELQVQIFQFLTRHGVIKQ